MRINWSLAAAAGLLGAVVMILVLWLARMAALTEFDFAASLGSAFTHDLSASAWTLGFIIHTALGIAFALAYAEVFEALGRATWTRGVLLAIPHALFAGLVIWALPNVNPLIPQELPAPGYMAVNYGWLSFAVYVLMHLAFGAIVGGLYEVRPEHAVPRRRPLRPRTAW